MPVAASCPRCRAPLSETSVLALAPICSHCGMVITTVGGTLGLTSAYGIGDPTITRKRVEADLAVFREYQMKYRGMLEACKQQLDWGVERYAHLPQPPEFLELQNVPSFWIGLVNGLGMALIWIAVSFIGQISQQSALGNPIRWGDRVVLVLAGLIIHLRWGGCVVAVLAGLFNHFRVKVANGDRPSENARRRKAHKEATAAALKAAEPIKAAEDHRLRCQIRELEGLVKTVAEKEADVRRLLATL